MTKDPKQLSTSQLTVQLERHMARWRKAKEAVEVEAEGVKAFQAELRSRGLPIALLEFDDVMVVQEQAPPIPNDPVELQEDEAEIPEGTRARRGVNTDIRDAATIRAEALQDGGGVTPEQLAEAASDDFGRAIAAGMGGGSRKIKEHEAELTRQQGGGLLGLLPSGVQDFLGR